MKDIIERLKRELAALLTTRDQHTALIATTRAAVEARSDHTMTAEESTAVEAAVQARSQLDVDAATVTARITELSDELARDEAAERLRRELAPAPGTQRGRAGELGGPALVTGEPVTYSERSSRDGVSWFRDAYLGLESRNPDAMDRLVRHGREVTEQLRERGQAETRAVSTGNFAGLIPPQYLTDMYALALRAGRPFADYCTTGLDLPSEGMSLVIPRATTGAAVASQTAENTPVQETDEIATNLTVPVATIAGQQPISRQSLERGMPGIDQMLFLDLTGAYNAELDRQCIAGLGTGNQMLGALNTGGINSATAFGAPPTPTLVNLKTAGQVYADTASGTMVTPRRIAMHPRRWGWFLGQVDASGRPLVVPLAPGSQQVIAQNAMGPNVQPGAYSGDPDASFVGYVQGLPVITDANIPTAFGTAAEDVILVVDNRQLWLWEDPDSPKQLRFEQTLGNQLTVELVLYGYAAFTAGRYPSAVGRVGGADTVAGNGLTAPQF